MVLTEGLFKGEKAILLLPEAKPNNRPSLLGLPPEVRNLIYEELFRGTDDKISVATQKRHGNTRVYMTVSVKSRNGRVHDQEVAPFTRTAIFRTNRQVYEETTTMFFGTKTFFAPNTNKMLAFLQDMGSAKTLIRKMEVTAPRYESLREFGTMLQDIAKLESLHLDSKHWMNTAHSSQRLWGNARWRVLPVKYTYEHLIPFLQAAQKYRQDIQVVSEIVHFDDWDCTCQGYDHDKKEWRCQAVIKEIKEYKEEFRKRVVDSLQAAEDASKEKAKRKLEEQQRIVEKLDDFSYLQASPAPERRDTGRPKRRTVTEKSVSYAE